MSSAVDVTASGRFGLDPSRRRLQFTASDGRTFRSRRLPLGRTVRATITLPGGGWAAAWVHLTPPRRDPQAAAVRTAYRRRQVARRRRNRR